MIIEVPSEPKLEAGPAVAMVAKEAGIRAGKAVVKKIFAPKRKEVPVEVTPAWQKYLPFALGGAGIILLTILFLKKTKK